MDFLTFTETLPPHCDLAFTMFAIVESVGDRNVLLCHSSKKYPLGEHRGQGSLIGGSSWRRILYGVQLPDSGCTAHFHQPPATALMKSFSLFINKDDTNASAPVAMTRAYTLSIACMYGVRHRRWRFWRITSEDRTLWTSNGYVNLLD